MNTELPKMSPQMERMAKCLAARYEIDWSQKGARLTLAILGRAERWLLMNLDGLRFSLTCCLVEQDDNLVPEVDMVFTMHATGWEPIELLYSHEVFTTYVQATQAAGRPVYNAEGNLRFDTFTEYWAQQLEEQGWLAQSHRLPEAESYGRIPGCESTNHTACYGELWQCEACGKTVCYAEGTTDHPDLCDDCWVARFDPMGDVHTYGVTFTQHGAFQLVCDCPEQCGTGFTLSHDGFLLLEDKNGLLVSFMLPDWLDFAIRSVMLAHTATADNSPSIQATSTTLDRLADDLPF